MIYLLTALFIIIWATFIHYDIKYLGNFSTSFVFGIIAFIYFVYPPLSLAIFSKHTLALNAATIINITSTQQITIVFGALLALTTFLGTIFLARFSQKNFSLAKFDQNQNLAPDNSKKTETNILSFIIFLLFATLIFYHKVIWEMRVYAMSYKLRFEHPALSVLITATALGLGLLTAVYYQKKKRARGLFCFGLTIAIGMYFSYKIAMVPGICGLLAGISHNRRIRSIPMVIMTLLALPFLFTFIVMFSIYRNINHKSGHYLSLIIKNITNQHLDFAGLMRSIVYYINHPEPISYFKSLTIFIPKFIYPNRPLDIANRFAQKMMLNWSPGKGLGFSPLAEAYANAGIFWGPIVHYMLFAIIWIGIWTVCRKIFSKSLYLYKPFYQVFGMFFLIISFRTTLIGSTKQMLINLIPYLAVVFISKYTINIKTD